MARAFDALSVPDPSQYRRLRALGYEVASGYTRALTDDAITAALGAGLAVLPLTEAGDPTSAAYFTLAQAQADADAWLVWASAHDVPEGVPVVGVFLDFDCPVSIMDTTVLPFVNVWVSRVNGRDPLWIYGPIDPIEYALRRWPAVAGAMQAHADAWSGGRNAQASGIADVIQLGGATVAGIPLDHSVVRTETGRLWRAAT